MKSAPLKRFIPLLGVGLFVLALGHGSPPGGLAADSGRGLQG